RLAAGPEVNGGQADLASRRRFGFRQRYIAPLDLAARRPEQGQLDDGLGRLVWHSIRVGNLGPPLGVGLLVGPVVPLGGPCPTLEVALSRRLIHGDRLSLVVLPENPHDRTAARLLDFVYFAQRLEAIVAPARDRKALLPPAVQSFPLVGRD